MSSDTSRHRNGRYHRTYCGLCNLATKTVMKIASSRVVSNMTGLFLAFTKNQKRAITAIPARTYKNVEIWLTVTERYRIFSVYIYSK